MSYNFGGDTGVDYESLKRKQALADMLRGRASQMPTTAADGLVSVANALAARHIGKKADAGLESGRAEADAAFNDIVNGGVSPPSPQMANAPQSQPIAPQGGGHYEGDGHDHSNMNPQAVEAFRALESAWGQPLPINSAYRDPEHNARVGGAKRSQHVNGNAYDIDVSNLDQAARLDLIKAARAQGFQGVGVYDNALHLDVGPERAWGADFTRNSLPDWAKPAINGATGQAVAPSPRLMAALSNPFLSEGKKAVLQQMYEQQVQASTPMTPYQQAQLQADADRLAFDREKLQAAQSQREPRKIVKLADGFSYFVNPDSTTERVNPDVKAKPSGGIGLRIGENGTVELTTGGQTLPPTNTPRDPEKLAQKLSEADAKLIEAEREKSASADTLIGLADQLEHLSGQVGYTGPGGEIYGKIDDAVGLLPGDSGARAAFRSTSMEAQLSFTEKTKGAITDREMGMFKAAVPNLGQTPEGNKQIVTVMKAGAARIAQRAEFMERYAAQNGSLQSAQEAWRGFIENNPLLVPIDGGGFELQEAGDYTSYLNMAGEGVELRGTAAPTLTDPNGVEKMSNEEFVKWLDEQQLESQ